MTELQKHQTAEILRFLCLGVCFLIGGVAQLGERLLCKQEVIGSNPFTSTTGEPSVRRATGAAELDREAPLAKRRKPGRVRRSEKLA